MKSFVLYFSQRQQFLLFHFNSFYLKSYRRWLYSCIFSTVSFLYLSSSFPISEIWLYLQGFFFFLQSLSRLTLEITCPHAQLYHSPAFFYCTLQHRLRISSCKPGLLCQFADLSSVLAQSVLHHPFRWVLTEHFSSVSALWKAGKEHWNSFCGSCSGRKSQRDWTSSGCWHFSDGCQQFLI